MCFKILSRLFGSFERPSPQDLIPRDAIKIYEDRTRIEIDITKLKIPLNNPEIWILDVVGTGSMDPVMDATHNTFLIKPVTSIDHQIMCDNLKVGDIAVFKVPDKSIIHRVVKIGSDGKGRYFRFQGDNNPVEDSYIVRDENIIAFSIGTIY